MSVTPPTEAITVTAPQPAAAKSHFWAGSGFSFHDVLDAINPLQHIPVVGTIYRAVTGDTIGNVARVAGDGLYGGVIGLAAGVIDVASLEETGKDVGQHIVATLEDLGDALDPSSPAAKPAGPAADPSAALVAAAGQVKDPPKLPLLGSATTAGELAAAAPISPLLAPKLAAQAQAAVTAPAPGAIRPIRPLSSPSQGIPIDVSDHGIALMRATSAAHNPQPVSLQLPPGAVVLSGAAAPATTKDQSDFSERMRAGLAKYDALVAARARDTGSNTVDQLH